jgi:hypothetical protein
VEREKRKESEEIRKTNGGKYDQSTFICLYGNVMMKPLTAYI